VGDGQQQKQEHLQVGTSLCIRARVLFQ